MSSTPEKNTRPNFARRIKWLGVGTVCVFALYCAGWFTVASIGQAKITEALNTLNQNGTRVVCDQNEIKGFPFRLGIFCSAVEFSQPDQGIALSAGAMRSAAQVYDPKHGIIELDGPATITLPNALPVTLNWSLLRASARVAQPLPERVSLEAKSLILGKPGGPKIMSADYAALHMRVEGKDVAFAGEGGDVMVDPTSTPGRIIPQFSASYDVVMDEGVAVIASRQKSMRSISGTVRQCLIIFKDGGTIKLSGPIKVADDGLLDADLSFDLRDTAPLAIALASAAPEAKSMITNALGAASLTKGDDKPTKIDITIRRGKVSIGFIPIGQIPPLQ